jgi:hypothetical protein
LKKEEKERVTPFHPTRKLAAYSFLDNAWQFQGFGAFIPGITRKNIGEFQAQTLGPQ